MFISITGVLSILMKETMPNPETRVLFPRKTLRRLRRVGTLRSAHSADNSQLVVPAVLTRSLCVAQKLRCALGMGPAVLARSSGDRYGHGIKDRGMSDVRNKSDLRVMLWQQPVCTMMAWGGRNRPISHRHGALARLCIQEEEGGGWLLAPGQDDGEGNERHHDVPSGDVEMSEVPSSGASIVVQSDGLRGELVHAIGVRRRQAQFPACLTLRFNATGRSSADQDNEVSGAGDAGPLPQATRWHQDRDCRQTLLGYGARSSRRRRVAAR